MKSLKEIFAGFGVKGVNEHSHQLGVEVQTKTDYQCPMKCEGEKMYDVTGNCPKCNMKLAPVNNKSSHDHHKHNHGCC